MRSRKLNGAINLKYAKPTQTFFIPMPEGDVFENALRKINSGIDTRNTLKLPWVRGRMISLVSVAISTDNTIIYYDHWA